MLREHMDVPFGRKTGGLPRLGDQIKHHDGCGIGFLQSVPQPGHLKMWQNRSEPRTRTQRHQISIEDSFNGLLGCRRRLRNQPDSTHLTRRGGHCDLATDLAHDASILLQANDFGLNL